MGYVFMVNTRNSPPEFEFYEVKDADYDLVLAFLAEGTLPPVEQKRRVRIVADLLNVRSGPSCSHAIVGQVTKGEEFEVPTSDVDGEGNEWVSLGARGWIARWLKSSNRTMAVWL